MDPLLRCFVDWLNDNRSEMQAWRILEALANETIKVARSSYPGQMEFDALDLAQVCQPDKAWDYEAAKRWFNRAKVSTYLDARKGELEAHFRSHGHSAGLALAQRKTVGRHRAPWFLHSYDLPAADERRSLDPADSGTGVAPVGGSTLVYEFTGAGEIKLNPLGRLLLNEGSIKTKSWRGIVWGGLVIAAAVLVALCLLLAWVIGQVRTPLMTRDITLTLGYLAMGWASWLFLLRPLIWLLEDRIIPAGVWLTSWNEEPAQLDMAKDGGHRHIRLVRYGGVCPICAGVIELRYGQGANARRLFGCCGEAPQEHVFTFDRVTRNGVRYSQ